MVQWGLYSGLLVLYAYKQAFFLCELIDEVRQVDGSSHKTVTG